MKNLAPKYSFLVGNTQVAIYHANLDEGLVKHHHLYPHVTVCNSGSCVVRKEGKELILTKDSQPVLLKEIEWHEIEALEDETVFTNIFDTKLVS